jgi:hypothetical protein
MAAWTDPATSLIRVAVRNASAREVCYCQAPHDYTHTVYARKDSASPWQVLRLKTDPGEITVVAICNTQTLKPNDEMSPGRSPAKDHSYSVELRAYEFPDGWNGAVEIKIVQSFVFCNRTGNKLGDLESRPLRISVPVGGPL